MQISWLSQTLKKYIFLLTVATLTALNKKPNVIDEGLNINL